MNAANNRSQRTASPPLLRGVGGQSAMQTSKTRRHFWIGVLTGWLLAVGWNLLPYLRTRGAYAHDDLEVIGFPFVFRALGGFAYRLYVYWWALLADFLLAVLFALAVGIMWSKLPAKRSA